MPAAVACSAVQGRGLHSLSKLAIRMDNGGGGGGGGQVLGPAAPSSPEPDVAAGSSTGPVSDALGGITIRPIRARDLNDLRRLDRLLFPVIYSDAFYHNLLVNPNLSRVAVDADNKIVGCVTSRHVRGGGAGRSPWVSTPAPCFGYISTLGVDPAIRRQGLGLRLLQIVLDELDKECDVIMLHVKADNAGAIELYLAAGFVRVKYLQNHYFFDNRYHDAIQLQRGQSDSLDSIDSALDREDDASWTSWASKCIIL